jgi:hypothetical protein
MSPGAAFLGFTVVLAVIIAASVLLALMLVRVIDALERSKAPGWAFALTVGGILYIAGLALFGVALLVLGSGA